MAMREEVHIISPSPVTGSAPHGLPTPANDVPPKGFTAVNGEPRSIMSFRPDDSGRPTINTNISNGDYGRHRPSDSASTHSSYTPHNWRPHERITSHPEPPREYRDPAEDRTHRTEREHHNASREHRSEYGPPRPQSETDAGHKRRRPDSPDPRDNDTARNDRYHASAEQPPKRRMMPETNDEPSSPGRRSRSSAFPSDHRELPQPNPATSAREHSPVHRADRGEPPPQPRPEIQDQMAAELQRSLDAERPTQANGEQRDQTNADQHGDAGRSSSPESPSPEAQNETDQAQTGDQDPKKRKRNFSNRTKTGCHTCRARKKKCDEGKPTCENCKRGSFECGGYGAKPPGGAKISAMRQHVPIQARQFGEPHPHAPPPYHEAPPPHYQHSPRPPPPWDPVRPESYPPPPHHYGPPAPMEHRPPSVRDGWGPRPPWGPDPNPTYLSERLPPVDYSNVPPQHAYPGRYPDFRPPPDPWAPPHPQARLPPGPPPIHISSRESVHSTGSGNSGTSRLLMLPPSGPPSEKTKMLTGQPYKRCLDNEIQLDRKSCARAVEAYNNACTASSPASMQEQGRLFTAITDPRKRTFLENLSSRWTGPVGFCGDETIVASPFSCDFGYNIHLGHGTLIESGCSMQDAALIVIGDRVIVGPNVRFCCITASVDPSLRFGSQGNFVAGAIRVEDDVYIGANVTVMPYRTIGKGAVVGAGSVVTRDVKPYTVVAGNPAKPVRKRKIESGPNVDRHDDSIQEENDKMVEWMKQTLMNPIQPRGKGDGA